MKVTRMKHTRENVADYAEAILKNAKRALLGSGRTMKSMTGTLGISYSKLKKTLSPRNKEQVSLEEALAISYVVDQIIEHEEKADE